MTLQVLYDGRLYMDRIEIPASERGKLSATKRGLLEHREKSTSSIISPEHNQLT